MAVLATPATGAPEPPVEWDKPSGTSVSFVVVDRQTGQVRAEHAAHTQYRSASLVKLLIALDYVESRGPDAPIPPGDRALLESMLRSSDDDAASELWVRGGWETIVQRMADRLELTDTEPPADRRVWGYTATSAADVARIYEYLLDKADPSVSDVILGNLRMATRCAADGRDQYFGIPTAVDEPWAVKQGWSGYEEVVPGEECHERIDRGTAPEEIPTLRDAAIRAQADRGPDIDLTRRAMHTSGTIGADHNMIMVLLSLHPEGTPYQTSAQQVTAIVRALYLAVKVAPPDPVRRWPDVESR
ncbi:MAG: hypothetical protein JO115_03360 [Pseudonocardiales bacterium]|nr:hypothetical protein [Pseudonocardiales bacterium]